MGGLRDRDRARERIRHPHDPHNISRTPSSMSFADSSSSRIWSSTGSASLSPRSATDDILWTKFGARRVDRIRRKRHSSYACSDYEVSESDSLVEIGERLPDRPNAVAEEDVFGRRRGDFVRDLDFVLTPNNDPVLAADLDTVSKHHHDDDTLRDINAYLKGSSIEPHHQSTPHLNRISTTPTTTTTHQHDHTENGDDDDHHHHPGDDEEATIRHITKAIDSSKGRLRKSANMSRAFRTVIKSGEGLVRKSEHLKATINSDDSNDPSMIILLHPTSHSPASKQPVDKTSTTSDEAASLDTSSSAGARHNTNTNTTLGFSTSMTAKQCAATLETLLREMGCRVSRYPTDPHDVNPVLRLRTMRVPLGGRRIDRKIKIIVTIREEDHIRTSVSFKRLSSLYSSRNSHIPLCTEIRDRFQREWPAVVEALYIRLPNSSLAPPQDPMPRQEPPARRPAAAM